MKKQINLLFALVLCLSSVLTSCKENSDCEFQLNYYIPVFTVEADYADEKAEMKEDICEMLDLFFDVENLALKGQLMSNSDAKKVLEMALPAYEAAMKKEITHPGITKLEVEVEMWNVTEKEAASRKYIIVIDVPKKKK